MSLARNGYTAPPSGSPGELPPTDAELVSRLRALVRRHGGWSFWRYHYRLRKLSVLINHQRPRRAYQALSLQLGERRKKKPLLGG